MEETPSYLRVPDDLLRNATWQFSTLVIIQTRLVEPRFVCDGQVFVNLNKDEGIYYNYIHRLSINLLIEILTKVSLMCLWQ